MPEDTQEPTPLPEQNHESDQIDKNKYRFGGVRYGFRGPAHSASNDMVPNLPSLMTAPRSDS